MFSAGKKKMRGKRIHDRNWYNDECRKYTPGDKASPAACECCCLGGSRRESARDRYPVIPRHLAVEAYCLAGFGNNLRIGRLQLDVLPDCEALLEPSPCFPRGEEIHSGLSPCKGLDPGCLYDVPWCQSEIHTRHTCGVFCIILSWTRDCAACRRGDVLGEMDRSSFLLFSKADRLNCIILLGAMPVNSLKKGF